jgi:hypothetical protein
MADAHEAANALRRIINRLLLVVRSMADKSLFIMRSFGSRLDRLSWLTTAQLRITQDSE